MSLVEAFISLSIPVFFSANTTMVPVTGIQAFPLTLALSVLHIKGVGVGLGVLSAHAKQGSSVRLSAEACGGVVTVR